MTPTQQRQLDEKIARALGAYIARGGELWVIPTDPNSEAKLYIHLDLPASECYGISSSLPRFSCSWAATAALRAELKRRGLQSEFAAELLKGLAMPQQWDWITAAWLLADASPGRQALAALEALEVLGGGGPTSGESFDVNHLRLAVLEGDDA